MVGGTGSSWLSDPGLKSIAILGRSRPQLAPILELLRQRDIPFASQEMDALAGSPAIVDLMTLCRALMNPGDRVAWFSLLRAPWCGLNLADMKCVADSAEDPRYQNVYGALCNKELPCGLSDGGRQRLIHVGQCLRWAEQKRDRLGLRVWIEQLWMHLGGPACFTQKRFLADAERFLSLLQLADAEGIGLNVDWLNRRISRLYASGDAPDARLQVMTLHKSKGLEFDWVLIPALARATRGDSRDILLWDEHNSTSGERGFLLAADDHSDDKTPGLYNFLKKQRKEKSRLETTRLLYVGATRAVKKLTLSACLVGGEDAGPDEVPELKPPGEGALLAPIWPSFEQQMSLHASVTSVQSKTLVSGGVLRLTQPPATLPLIPEDSALGTNTPDPALNWPDRYVGTVIHELLEQLSKLTPLPDTLTEPLVNLASLSLASLGLAGEKLDSALERVVGAAQLTLADTASGRWMLSAEHDQAASELPLTIQEEGEPRDIIIDRTFVDRETGIRWIIDYKSSAPETGVSEASFLRAEADRYMSQMRCYRNAMSALGPEPVRCALYFTGMSCLHHLSELDR